MADENSLKGHRTQIIIAVIALFSAVAVAVIANFDKLFPNKPVNENTASTSPAPVNNSKPKNDDRTDVKNFSQTQMVGNWQTVTAAFTINMRLAGNNRFDNDMTYSNGEYIAAKGNWTYSGGVYSQHNEDGSSLKGNVEWIDIDTFDFTMTQFNGMPPTSVMVVRYRRK